MANQGALHKKLLCIPVFVNIALIVASIYMIVISTKQAVDSYNNEKEFPTTKVSINERPGGLNFPQVSPFPSSPLRIFYSSTFLPQVVVCSLFVDTEGTTNVENVRFQSKWI